MSLRITLATVLPACSALLLASCANTAEDTPAATDRVIAVTTVFRGAAPLEVETAVTIPIEHALHGLPGTRAVTSTSRDGESVVSLELSPEHDRDQAKAAVAEAIACVAAQLPAGAEPPAMTTMARDAWPGIWLTLTADEAAPMELLVAAQRVRDHLLRIPRVAEVRIFGGRPRELQVRCDPRKLVAHGLSLDGCLRAIEREANGRPLTPDGLLDLVLARQDDVPIRVRDVADVRDAAGPPDSLAWIDGQPTVAIGLFVHGEVTQASLERIRNELARIEGTIPQSVTLTLTAGAESVSHGGLLVELFGPPGGELEILRKLADQLERRIRPLAAGRVLSIWTRDNDMVLRLLFHTDERVPDEDTLLGALRRHGNELPGVKSRVAQLAPGAGAWRPRFDVDLALMGPDRDQLKKWSELLIRRLARTGYQDVVDEAPALIPEITLTPHRDRLAQVGLDLPSVERAMQAGMHGVLLSGHENDGPLIRVFLENDFDEQKIASLQVPAGDSLLRLTALVDAEMVAGVDKLQRRNMRPMVRVTAALPADGDSAQNGSALRLAEEIRLELQLSDEYSAERR